MMDKNKNTLGKGNILSIIKIYSITIGKILGGNNVAGRIHPLLRLVAAQVLYNQLFQARLQLENIP